MSACRALITGITGQDGSYLAELLLEKGYEVHGLVRRASHSTRGRVTHIANRIQFHDGDLLDTGSLHRVLREVNPHEIYNLAAQSHVGVSFSEPVHTGDVTGLGAVRLLEATRQCALRARFYQASSSEMFGNSPGPQSEDTPLVPRSPYASAKVFAHNSVRNYREAYGLHASCGILHNHESPRRGEEFVTRKITRAAARIRHGLQQELMLGNLEARRDWGHVKDYVRAMWLMLQQQDPGDYVIATGVSHSVRDVLDIAFDVVGVDWKRYVRSDATLLRPSEVVDLRGDASRARRVLGWEPTITFHQMIREMVHNDLDIAYAEAQIKR